MNTATTRWRTAWIQQIYRCYTVTSTYYLSRFIWTVSEGPSEALCAPDHHCSSCFTCDHLSVTVTCWSRVYHPDHRADMSGFVVNISLLCRQAPPRQSGPRLLAVTLTELWGEFSGLTLLRTPLRSTTPTRCPGSSLGSMSSSDPEEFQLWLSDISLTVEYKSNRNLAYDAQVSWAESVRVNLSDDRSDSSLGHGALLSTGPAAPEDLTLMAELGSGSIGGSSSSLRAGSPSLAKEADTCCGRTVQVNASWARLGR